MRGLWRALPDVSSLAMVADDQLLKLWEGLGYYNRATEFEEGCRYDCG